MYYEQTRSCKNGSYLKLLREF